LVWHLVEREGKRLVIRFVPDYLGTPRLLLEEQQTTYSVQALEKLALTKREAEVVFWVARGKSNMDIGAILSISPRTVQKHLQHIYEKLGVENRTAAANRVLEVLAGEPNRRM
jgi:DNA-binding CsgD family transcriptional regulator